MPKLSIYGKIIPCSLILFDLDGTLLDDGDRYKNLAEARVKAIKSTIGEEAAERWARISGVNPDTYEVDMD